MANAKPFQLLEINIMSAQDLEQTSKKMRTYATLCLNPTRRLTTAVDYDGRNNPTWNDKFVFRVDDEFLQRDTSAIQIEIFSVNWFRDSVVGSVRFLVGNLFPPPSRPGQRQNFGMRFVALQVRRPSGRPQGILNIGVALLDSSMRSMPLYRQMSMSAVGFRDLMHDDHLHHNTNDDDAAPNIFPILRRMKSERSTLMSYDNDNHSSLIAVPFSRNNNNNNNNNNTKAGSVIEKESSILSISFQPPPPAAVVTSKKGKASSMVNAIESSNHQRGKKGKSSSVVSDSFIHKKDESGPSGSKNPNGPNEPIRPISMSIGPNYGGPAWKGGSMVSESEVGPSPSEVAAAMAVERRYPLEQDGSVLDGWSVDESMEGLRSKLERWRAELPTLYDRGGYDSSSFRSSSYHMRRHTDGGGKSDDGKFSCFGNIFGYECECVCGQPAPQNNKNYMYKSPSVGSFL